ncbi:hypothetical protein RR42_s0683 [Cupriavidus basilensis]|uniref:Uncharacterized protein n=1 Tax=Cupriavidus basilensis TaxID=68895 RepID=A0A0C4YJZ4_9BURK|nr:hypothetical protein RR42_s0683 [Cupriavidus basilensis]
MSPDDVTEQLLIRSLYCPHRDAGEFDAPAVSRSRVLLYDVNAVFWMLFLQKES